MLRFLCMRAGNALLPAARVFPQALAGCPDLRQIVVGSPLMLMLLAPLRSVVPGVVVTLRSRTRVATIGQSLDLPDDSPDSPEVLTYKW